MSKLRMMKRIGVVLLASVLVFGAAAPGAAGGKTRRGKFTTGALPYPNHSMDTGSPTRDSCIYGVYTQPNPGKTIVARKAGMLTATMRGFTGDWDLYLVDGATIVVVGSIRNQLAGDAAEEQVIFFMEKKDTVKILPCNWLGQTEVEVSWEFVPAR